MLIAVCSSKGSPGATSTALALASAWPSHSNAVVVEADPAGGDLAIRLRPAEGALPPSPTVATLAAASRDPRSDLVRSLAASVSEGLSVIPGYLTREHGRGMAGMWESLATACGSADVDVIVDVGRYDASSPASVIVGDADAVAVVLRADPAGVVHARELLRQLLASKAQMNVQPIVVTKDRDAPADRADVDLIFASAGLELSPTLHLAWDPAAVGALEAGHSPRARLLSRSKLVRSAQAIVDRVADAPPGIAEVAL